MYPAGRESRTNGTHSSGKRLFPLVAMYIFMFFFPQLRRMEQMVRQMREQMRAQQAQQNQSTPPKAKVASHNV